MRALVSVLAVLVAASPLALAQDRADDAKAIQARLQAVRKHIDDLRLQEQVLRQQLEQAEKAARPKDEYVKVEVKGELVVEQILGPTSFTPTQAWAVSAAGGRWLLDFGDNKEWLALAEKHNRKTVLITGQFVPRVTGRTFGGPEPVLVVATFKAVTP